MQNIQTAQPYFWFILSKLTKLHEIYHYTKKSIFFFCNFVHFFCIMEIINSFWHQPCFSTGPVLNKLKLSCLYFLSGGLVNYILMPSSEMWSKDWFWLNHEVLSHRPFWQMKNTKVWIWGGKQRQNKNKEEPWKSLALCLWACHNPIILVVAHHSSNPNSLCCSSSTPANLRSCFVCIFPMWLSFNWIAQLKIQRWT